MHPESGMTDEERNYIRQITDAVPHMTEFQKGYLLGVGETIELMKEGRSDSGTKKKSAASHSSGLKV